MATGDLTTTARVRDFLGLDTTEADTKLGGYVSSSSAWAISQLGRPVLSATYTETHDGDNGTELLLDRWPVNSVTSVTVDGTAIAVRPTVSDSGYVIDGNKIKLVGYYFTKGTQNVVVVYRAGYEATQAGTIPASGAYTIATTSRYYDAISATLTAGSTALTEVASSPATGQYSVALDESTGFATYTFNSAQAGLAVSLVYATIPWDLEQAVIEHTAMKYRHADRQGVGAASGGGESVTWDSGREWASIQGLLDPYREPSVG